MASSEDSKYEGICDRLRETEAQTRAQNERISGLCDRLESTTSITDRFFEMLDRWHADDKARFADLCDHEKHLADMSFEREDKMWKIILMLIGTVVATAFGPKAVSQIYQSMQDSGRHTSSMYLSDPALPMPNHDSYASHPVGSPKA